MTETHLVNLWDKLHNMQVAISHEIASIEGEECDASEEVRHTLQLVKAAIGDSLVTIEDLPH